MTGVQTCALPISLFSTPSPAFIACRFLDRSHSDWCKVVPHCGFDLHFSNRLNAERRAAPAAAKSLQSCPTLCDPIDGSSPGSPIPGILQTRALEWVAISFSNAWKWKVKMKSLSCVQLLATPWTAAHQAPPSMGFSRQEYWSGVPLPSLPKSATWEHNPLAFCKNCLVK